MKGTQWEVSSQKLSVNGLLTKPLPYRKMPGWSTVSQNKCELYDSFISTNITNN